MVKKVIKLMKYWNTLNQKVFQSFELEKMVLKAYQNSNMFWGISQNANIKNSLFQFIEEYLEISYYAAQWKQDKVAKLKETIRMVRTLEQMSRFSYAVAELSKVFPSIT
ncbi:MAG: hypothetical protein LBR70_01935 [Lactobacillaceae bacterium]|nr:hypothetical protein [Lactobacillaceae bacterium]